ncbi:uracil-xanthine permease family protein [Desulfosediminicola flagellatus]|uniref:uracil-xanthine permease family protein n=1 Tax=Desulfosediminicola flagellatus TaxID=2569541 RepID=UPI0010AD595E|nr:nucleobase:cation symporter-2 family protein [Desulfosediminicola flagellatus]
MGITRSEDLRNPDYLPPLGQSIPLGIQHVLAMFASNVTPAIIVALAAGFSFGSAEMVYMIQIVMVFAGISTLLQTIGLGPVGARLPIVQGTSFAFIPIMIPIVKTAGMAALFGGVIVGGIFHFCLGTVIGRMRNLLPPLVTGIVVLTIGLALIPVGVKYAAGGVPLMGKPEFGALNHWALALIVIVVTMGLKFFTKGMTSTAAVLIALIVGYVVAIPMGMVNFGKVGSAAWFSVPSPMKFGVEFNMAAIIGMCLMSFVSAIETVGDISGITKGGAGREATDKEIAGGTMADGLGTALSGLFGGLPNTSFSQNVGLISMTGVMSRHVVTFGALFLVCAGLIPKVGALIAAMPISVLGGGVIVMFGMVVSAGVTMLSDVIWNRRNMLILAISLSIGLGLQAVPEALQHVPGTLKILLTSGILPAAILAIVLNMILPESLDD